jgi:hypothetical protein
VPLSLRGLPGLAVLGLVCFWARSGQDRVLLGLGIFGLGLFALLLLQVVPTALWLRLRRQKALEPCDGEAGVPCCTGYGLGWLSANPLLKFDVTWERPCGVRVGLAAGWRGLQEEVTAQERTLAAEVVRRIVVRDVFGLLRIRFRRRATQEVRFRPAVGGARAVQLPEPFRPGDQLAHPDGRPDGDLVETRPYARGDPLKRVLWKVYARTGRLMVRAPERAVAPCDRILAFLVAGPGDEPAAGIARGVLESGGLGHDFLFAASGQTEPARAVTPAVEQVVRSVNARDVPLRGLDELLSRPGYGALACILFVPGRPGPWLEETAAALARYQGQILVVVGVDGLSPARPQHWLRRLLLATPPHAAVSAGEVARVRACLSGAGARVTVVARPSGQALELPAN